MNFFGVVFAEIENKAIGDLGSLTGTQFLENFLSAIIMLGLVIAGVTFLFMLILGGIEWITAGGDKARVESARRRIANALIGILITFSFYVIVYLVSCFFGVNLLEIRVGQFDVGFTDMSSCQGSGGDTGDPGDPDDPGGCSPACTSGFFCSTVGEISECCRCVFGNDASGYGPVQCCTPPGASSGDCRTYNINGCSPDTS